MNAPTTDAGAMINTSKNVFPSHGASFENKFLHSFSNDQTAYQNDVVINRNADQRETPSRTDTNAALAQAAQLLMKISRKSSKNMDDKALQYHETTTLHTADYKESLSKLKTCLKISRRNSLKK